jgi:hypothetical protein
MSFDVFLSKFIDKKCRIRRKMYIHIGGEYSIPEKTILGIFDFDEVTGAESITSEYLKKAEMENRIEIVSYELPRSIVVAMDKVYISPISSRTIRKRMDIWKNIAT